MTKKALLFIFISCLISCEPYCYDYGECHEIKCYESHNTTDIFYADKLLGTWQ